MPAGIISEGRILLPNSATVGELSAYTTYLELEVVPPDEALTGPATVGVWDILDQNVNGIILRMWDFIYYGIIHVIPRQKNVDGVITQTVFTVEVWNADDAGHVGESVGVTGTAGVTVDPGAPALPATWSPFSSKFFDIIVDSEGDPVIDSLVTWVFPGFTGTDCHVIGYRVTVFAGEPQWDTAIVEGYGYMTDIIPSRDSSEQRIQLRENAIRALDSDLLTISAFETAEMMAKLFAGGRLLFAVPYWPDVVKVDQAIAINDTVIYCDTTTRIFEAGGQILVWLDRSTWEAFTIDTVNPTNLVVTTPAVNAWPLAGTVVVPALTTRLNEAAQVNRLTPEVAEINGTFTTEALE